MRSLDDIFGKKRSLDEIFAPSPQFSKEDIAKVKANNEEYAKRVEDNRPFFDKNPVGRLGVAVAQGISNSALNPAGYVARAYGVDTKPFTPQNAVERGVEKASEYGYDALALGGVGNIAKGAGYLGKGNTVTSKVLQEVFAPKNLTTMAVAPAVGGGFAEGVVNPTNEFERALVNAVGGGALGGLASGVKQTSKPINKGLKGALPDNEANKALSKGIRASEEVAEQVSSQAPSAYNSLNDEMENALNKAVGRKLNYEKSISNQQERIDDFIGKNADKELFSSKSAKKQAKENFNKWFEGSKVVDEQGKPLTLYHGTRADFDAFDINKAGQSNGNISKIGFWLTPEKQIAKDFSESWYSGKKPKVLSTYVNFKKPKIYKNVDNTEALKNVESNIKDIKDNMQKIINDYSYGNMNQLRYYTQYDDFYDIAKMRGYTREEADAALKYWNYDKQLDDLLFEQRVLQANDSYDQLMNDLDEYSKFIQHVDGVKDFRRGSHISDLAITNQDEAISKLKERLKKEGYDSIIIENTSRDTQNIGENVSQYIAFEPNQIKSVKNSGAWSSSPSLTDAGWTPKASLKSFTQGLNETQLEALNKAINEGAKMSTHGKGSLHATHKAQNVLNDMIDKSYNNDNPFSPKPTTETHELMGLKQVLNKILEPSGIKPYDASYSKAKNLENAYKMGVKFKPSKIKFENLGLATKRDKQAFLQGYSEQMVDNVLSDGGTNLATAIKKGENVFRELMPEKRFNELMNTADKIETQFKRLKSLEGQANRRLVKDTSTGSSINRENFESRGAMLGRLSDIIGGAINRGRNIDIAKQYLNSDELVTRGGLKGFLKGSGTTGTRQLLIDLLNNE